MLEMKRSLGAKAQSISSSASYDPRQDANENDIWLEIRAVPKATEYPRISGPGIRFGSNKYPLEMLDAASRSRISRPETQ